MGKYKKGIEGMNQFSVDTFESYTDTLALLKSGEMSIKSMRGTVAQVTINGDVYELDIDPKYLTRLSSFKPTDMNDLIYGKDKTSHIVNISIKADVVHIFQEIDGNIIETTKPFKRWALANKLMPGFEFLKGNQYYNCYREFTSDEWESYRKQYFYKADHYTVWNNVENYMIRNGITYFKSLKPDQISLVSFDIESDSLNQTENSEVYIITNTFRKKDAVIRKAFFLEDYNSQKEMLDSWCTWIKEMNPSVMLGHNIYGYDFGYLNHVAKLNDTRLLLGRDKSEITFNERVSQKRKDGSQSYDYHEAFIFGRDIIDTMFLSLTYDVSRQFPSYGLKPIIKHLGLEKEGRSFVDASKIKQYYYDRKNDPEMWNKVKQYAIEDSDDALKLFDMMIPSFFYFTQSIRKTFTQIINSATGSQINNLLVGSYLQDNYSIPKFTEIKETVKGGISFAVPGIYRNVQKWDLRSAYPSQILRFKLFDEQKDPKAHYYKMVEYFTNQRFEYKRKFKETGDKYYKDRDSSSKIFINSSYGLTITSGLNFNSPAIGAKITQETREVIDLALRWASGKDKDYWMDLFQERIGKKDEFEK